MPQVHCVKKAAKDYPDHGIKKGEQYYWWKFKFGGKRFSKVPPKQSQLTQSEFLSSVYALNERLEDLSDDLSPDDLKSELEDIASEFRQLADDCDEKRSNMPDSLQDSDSGQLLESRTEQCNEVADNLESIDCEIDEEELKEDAKKNSTDFEDLMRDRINELIMEAQGYAYNGD